MQREKVKQSKKRAIQKPKLDNARRLRGIFFTEPNDEEFKHTMKNARRKLEIPMPAAIPYEPYNLVHKFIPMPQALNIPDAKAAVEKEWDKLEKIPAWQLTKVRNKKEVIEEARNNGRKVQVASLMDLCHLKNSELEHQYQKYKGRVILRGDIEKDDSGSYAVFTEQGSSASQSA